MRKKVFIKKNITMLSLAFVLSFNLLTGCGKETKKEKESDVIQTESVSMEVETETETEHMKVESEVTTEAETESEVVESTEVQEETETKVETETETSKKTTNKNNTGKNNASNNSNKNEGNKVGLDSDSYEYVKDGASSSQIMKEVELAKEIVKKIITDGMSDYEKVKAINDYIILNVSYDGENYKNNTIPAASYTALGAMEKKVAVCAGYARMFNVIAICAHLEAKYITGNTPYGYHAWNQVKVDGKWYNIDVTWNDPDCEEDEEGHYYCGCYEYFLVSNEDFNKTHTPMVSTLNDTGSTGDFEAYLQGCPYDGATGYYETQEDFDKLAEEMVASNITTIRIMSAGREEKEMILNGLKKQGIYEGCKVTTKDHISVYKGTGDKISKYTVEVSLESGSYKEIQKQKITSIDEAKTQLENCFNNFDSLKEGDRASVKLYVSPEYKDNNDFTSELYRWAQYEKKMGINISYYDVWDDPDICRMEVSFGPKGECVTEWIFYTKDMEPAIERMLQHGYTKVYMIMNPNDYQFAEELIEVPYDFINTYCKPLAEKYCLKVDWNFGGDKFGAVFESVGHNVENCNWEIEQEATCVSEGLEVKICWTCNKAGETRAIPKNDNHSYYWDTNGDGTVRVQKCELCSYVGITEYCYGGVWGYFDDEAAQQKLFEINLQRDSIQIGKHDEWGNALPAYSPPQLMVNKELEAKAKERLVELNLSDFEGYINHEYAIRRTPYSNTYQNKYASTSDMYHEKYDEIGIICFKFDYNGDATKFGIIYVMEFGLTDEYEALEQ